MTKAPKEQVIDSAVVGKLSFASVSVYGEYISRKMADALNVMASTCFVVLSFSTS